MPIPGGTSRPRLGGREQERGGGTLRQSPIFKDLKDEDISRLEEIGRIRTLRSGEYLFQLGDAADRLFVVTAGVIELCSPLALGDTVKDVCVESKPAGSVLGWSALVPPYRFTLSARSRGECDVVGFPRHDLQGLFEQNPSLGYTFMMRLAGVIGRRLLKLQALWARELQRTISAHLGPPSNEGTSDPES